MAGGDKWCCIIFVQQLEAWEEFEGVLDEDGEVAALRHLAQWDYGAESEYDVCEGEPERMRHVVESDGYVLTYDDGQSLAALYRKVASAAVPEGRAAL